MDLTNVMGAIGATLDQSKSTQGQLVDAFGQQKAALQDEATATTQAGVSQGIIDTQKAVGELQAQTNARKAATAIGTNMDDTSQIVTQLGQTMRDTALQLNQQSKVVANLDANSDLFGNPLGFVYDLLYGGGERKKLEGLQNELSTATKSMQAINQATQETAVTQNAIAATKSEATVSATQDLVAQQTQIAAAKVKERLAGVDVTMINNLSQLNMQQTQLAMQAHNIKLQDERMDWERLDRAQNSKDISTLMDTFNAGRALMGEAPVSNKAEFKIIQSSMDKNKFGFTLQQGFASQHGITPPVGRTPMEALGNVQATNMQLPEAQKDLVLNLSSTLGDVTNPAKVAEMLTAGGVKSGANQAALTMIQDHSKEGKANLQSKMLNYNISKMGTDLTAGGDNNIFAPPPMNVLAGAAELTKNPFLAKYVAAQITSAAADNTPIKFNPTNLLSYATQANQKDNISTNDISEGIAWIANQLRATNIATKGYQRFGITPPKGLILPGVVSSSGLVSGFKADIDWTDKGAVTTAVTHAVAVRKKQEINNNLYNSPLGVYQIF